MSWRWRDMVQWRTYAPGLYTRSEILQRNEKIKSVSTLLNNAGLALVAAGVARWFNDKLDGNVIFWLIVGVVSMLAAIGICAFLEADSQ